VIDTLRVLLVDCLIVFGGAVVLAVALRFGRVGLDALPMSRARRALVTRLRPLGGATLIAIYGVVAARWVLDSSDTREWLAFAVVLGVIAAASWTALRDAVEGVYLKVGRSFAVGDRVELAGIRGRIQKLGNRSVVLETVDGELAIVPYRTVAASTIRREPFDEQSSFHVFRVALPANASIPDLKRTINEAALLCHWSSTRRPPQVTATDSGELEITVFPLAADHAGELERVVRQALAG
jgi:small-conductance mechanosensitive channel